MKRLIVFLGMALAWVMPAKAQVTFGARAGGAYSCLIQKVNDRSESGARFGFSVAGVAEIPLTANKKWLLRPEVTFMNQGGAYYSNQDVNGMALYNECWYYSLQVPVDIAFKLKFTDVYLTIFAGPTVDFSLFGKMKSRETNSDLHFGMTEEKDLKPCDFGVNLGFSVEYSKFFFQLNALSGMIDRRATKREGETSVYQNNVTLSVGYFFRK